MSKKKIAEGVVTPDSSTEDFKKKAGELKEGLLKVENIVQAILWMGVITLVGIAVAVAAMIIDQFSFNQQMYSDKSELYSKQIEELNLKIDILTSKFESLEK